MADKTRPWSSINKLDDTPRGAMTDPRQCQKTKEWVVAQFLEISTSSPQIDGIILPLIGIWNYPDYKNYPRHMAHTLWSVLFSESG